MDRRLFLRSVPVAAVGLAGNPSLAGDYIKPANRNIKWGVSTNIWDQTKAPYAEILDNMKESGFVGIRLRGFPGILERWGLTQAQLHTELSKRGLHAITISFGLRDPDPAQ